MTELTTQPLCPSPDAVESAVGDETVILHLRNGTYYGLDVMGTRVWSLIKEGIQPSDISRRIADQYGVDLALVENDVRIFLADLRAQDILVDG